MLETLSSLSRLFSDSTKPYLHYRIAENLFCKSFNADNLSRSDTSADAALNGLGIGIKTFLKGNGKKFEKVAEFNRASPTFKNLKLENKIQEIVRLRNNRIQATKNIYNLNDMIYHCIIREDNKVSIIEEKMHFINKNAVKAIKVKGNTISFRDDKEEYNFSISKNTLFKRFCVREIIDVVNVKIIEDPFSLLEKMFNVKATKIKDLIYVPAKSINHVYLPLYSTRSSNKDAEKIVPEKSGLNQWNANGRARKADEVYIPVPKSIYKIKPNFFPNREKVFNLQLPTKKIVKAKMCQEGGKGLMSNPNTDLGNWLLREVLSLKEGELATYKKLEELGLDSVIVYKKDSNNYEIDFAKIGSFEEFIDNNQ